MSCKISMQLWLQITYLGAGDRAQGWKALTALSEDHNSTPSTHVIAACNCCSKEIILCLWPLQTAALIKHIPCSHGHAHSQIQITDNKIQLLKKLYICSIWYASTKIMERRNKIFEKTKSRRDESVTWLSRIRLVESQHMFLIVPCCCHTPCWRDCWGLTH